MIITGPLTGILHKACAILSYPYHLPTHPQNNHSLLIGNRSILGVIWKNYEVPPLCVFPYSLPWTHSVSPLLYKPWVQPSSLVYKSWDSLALFLSQINSMYFFQTFIVTHSTLPDYTVFSFAGNLINPPLVQQASSGLCLEASQRETNMDEDQSI